jgi:hypothetical protein
MRSTIDVPSHIQDLGLRFSVQKLCIRLSAFLTPLRSGLVSLLVRQVPYSDNQELLDAKTASIHKEIAAAVTQYHPAQLDYSSILTFDKRYTYRLFHNTPLATDIQFYIFKSLSSTKVSVSQRILFPDFSTKTIGATARKNAAGHTVLDESPIESTRDLEVFYHMHGFRFIGPTELRQAFKFLDLGPRTYYARGSSVYYDSRYIQPIFNILVDALGITHRFTRYHTHTVPLTAAELAFIYDYSSFTSTLHEIRNFCTKLATFFRDTSVTIIDTFDGIIEVNLGRMLEEWNQTCNLDPDFDVSVLLDINAEDGIIFHNCGMLGVPGNISSCTLLHGIHLAVILENYAKGKVIGDDAFFVFSREKTASGYDIISLMDALTNLGRVVPEKVEQWDVEDIEDDDTWHYTKRPIVRVSDERMYFGKQIIWPSIANALDLDDKVHTHPVTTLFERRKKYGNQVFRFLRTVEELGDPTEEDMELVSRFLRSLHSALDIPWYGFAPNHRDHPFFVPSSQWTGHFIETGVEACSACIISIPMEFDSRQFSSVDLGVGAEFCYRSIPALTLLLKLGYLERRVVRQSIVVSENWELVDRFLRRDYGQFVYSYVILKDVPEWSYSLLDAAHVPHERSNLAASESEILSISDIQYMLDV